MGTEVFQPSSWFARYSPGSSITAQSLWHPPNRQPLNLSLHSYCAMLLLSILHFFLLSMEWNKPAGKIKREKKEITKVLHELFILGGAYAAVGVDDSGFPHCLTPHVFLPILVPERAVDLEAAAGGRGVQAGHRGSVIILVRVCWGCWSCCQQENALFASRVFFHAVEISLFKNGREFWLKNFQDTHSGKPNRNLSLACSCSLIMAWNQAETKIPNYLHRL